MPKLTITFPNGDVHETNGALLVSQAMLAARGDMNAALILNRVLDRVAPNKPAQR